jgi:hypothetical protein
LGTFFMTVLIFKHQRDEGTRIEKKFSHEFCDFG